MKRLISLIIVFIILFTSVESVCAVTIGEERYNLFYGVGNIDMGSYIKYLSDLKKERGTEYSEEELREIYERIMYFVINRQALSTNNKELKSLINSILFVNIRNDDLCNCVEVVIGNADYKVAELFSEYICDSDAVVIWCYPFPNAPAGNPGGYAGVDVTLKASPTRIKLNAGDTKDIALANKNKVQLWKSSDSKIVSVKNGKVAALRKGTAEITAVYSSAVEVSVKYEVKNDPALKLGAKSVSSVTVKRKKTKTLKLSGKAASVNNKYKNTKTAKIISKPSSASIKIKGLKKGKTTLSVTVNGSKVFKIKVKVKK